eukprot:11176289-Lingulodinium_polyedra.AAC.1
MASPNIDRSELARGDIRRSGKVGRNRARSAGIEAAAVACRIAVTVSEVLRLIIVHEGTRL